MDRVGVRELRQDASVLLARVEASGDSIEITNHGRPVARLVPVTSRVHSTRAELIAAGLLRPGLGSPLDVKPVTAPPGSPPSGELLDADRNDR